ncbi:tyrosine recombinase XerC [Deinococcus altitudinis]|uniref:site-specific integrase n=1 Tax=Deinococcus altitudinis TaxID=468914 RepID=UPI0038918E18
MSIREEVHTALAGFDLEAAWIHLSCVLPQHPLTQRNHKYALKRYLDHARAEHADLLRPTPEFLEAYLSTFKALDPGHARSLFSRLRGLYKALRQLGVIPRTYDPLLTLSAPSLKAQPGEERRHFTEPEIDLLIRHAQDAEERCLILLGAHAGLKSGEVCGLDWTDVQLTEAELSVRGRVIPKDGLLDDALRDWARRHGGLLAEGSVFGYKDTYSVNQRLHRLCGRANLPYRPYTSLRSSYALRLWQSTHDPRIMVEQLGIGSLKAVEAYARMEERGR